MSKKVHAKEYLLEFSDKKPEWLKILIKEAIETNGSIPETRQNEIFDSLLNNTPLQDRIVQSLPVQQSSKKLQFESLTHMSGVNALYENQTIKFSPDITVLYGLNGSGKSSYFRVLNNMSGGVLKEIKPNIYINGENRKDINVSLKYKLGNASTTYNWIDSHSKLLDLYGVKVFDSSYLNGLLQTKNPSETLVYPLGLHLFGYIAKILDSYTVKLDEQVEAMTKKLPVIKIDELSKSIKNKFYNREDFNIDERKDIKEKFCFSDIEESALNEKEKELRQLQQNNFQDTINLLTKHNKEFSTFVDRVNTVTENFRIFGEKLIKALMAFKSAKKKNDEAHQRLEVLTLLPKSDTPEWKSFIKAGYDYSELLEQEKPEKCPYCRQELKTDEAIRVIRTYAVFLNDSSEKELNDSSKTLSEIRKQIEMFNVEIILTDEIKNIITESAELEKKIKHLSEYKTTLQSANNAEEIQLISVKFSTELKTLIDKKKENENIIMKLNTSRAEKDKKVEELQKEISNLKEKKSIFKQKTAIENYFSVYDRRNAIEAKKTETRTNQITALANLAQKALLTDVLKNNFENELKALGRYDLNVQLEIINGSKGKCNTQLKLIGNNSVRDILSEGEQKAVGLAMFFAEIQNENYPIILDDPVTSLDHEIAGKLAVRLLGFSNQVIVFCHNKLFLDGFENSKGNHICKTIDSACNDSKGKHIRVYRIASNGNAKGLLSNYKGDNSNALLGEAKKELNKTYFEENMKVSILIRRAVEKIIDEDVYKNELPPKVSNKTNRIHWDVIKSINPKPELIDKLRNVHDIVSEEIHDGTASMENPLSVDKLKELLAELMQIKEDFKS